jgi:hypothetical protein
MSRQRTVNRTSVAFPRQVSDIMTVLALFLVVGTVAIVVTKPENAVPGATIVTYAQDIKAGKAVAPWKGSPVPFVPGGGHGARPGPSKGICVGHTGPEPCTANRVTGVDAAGLTRWVYYRALGIDILGNGGSNAQRTVLRRASSARLGDLLFYGSEGADTARVGIFIGNGMMIEASPDSGFVRESPVSSYGHFHGYYRL